MQSAVSNSYNRIWVTFIDKEDKEYKIAARKGDNIMELAHEHNLEIEGACGGVCACSTCHIYVLDKDYYNRIPPETEAESDMLDMAFSLTETSRLGCQVVLTEDLSGIRVKIPSSSRNVQKADFEAK